MDSARIWAATLAWAGGLFGNSPCAMAEIIDMEFCNKFSQKIFIAIAYPQKNNTWLARGWLPVSPGQCDYYDSALRLDTFYYRAETAPYDVGNGNRGQHVWGEKADMKFYVGGDSFDNLDPSKPLDDQSRLVGFAKFFGNATVISQGNVLATLTFEADGQNVTYDVKPAT